MKHTVHVRCNLEQELLRLYKQAAAERRFEVAEHLLCALERMAATAPASACAVEEAYLFIVSSQAGKYHLRRSLTRDGSTAESSPRAWRIPATGGAARPEPGRPAFGA